MKFFFAIIVRNRRESERYDIFCYYPFLDKKELLRLYSILLVIKSTLKKHEFTLYSVRIV